MLCSVKAFIPFFQIAFVHMSFVSITVLLEMISEIIREKNLFLLNAKDEPVDFFPFTLVIPKREMKKIEDICRQA